VWKCAKEPISSERRAKALYRAWHDHFTKLSVVVVLLHPTVTMQSKVKIPRQTNTHYSHAVQAEQG
jgi:hypothetical protein